MQCDKSVQILVTGDPEELLDRLPLGEDGQKLSWVVVKVLSYERLPLPPGSLERFCRGEFHWTILTSPRTVRFLSNTLKECGKPFPKGIRVACIGKQTAKLAQLEGYHPEVFPSQSGSEAFLEDFLPRVKKGENIFIPIAEGGRREIASSLEALGARVVYEPLYRTHPESRLQQNLKVATLQASDWLVFTSPSSVDSFLRFFSIPESAKVACLGAYTSAHLEEKGVCHRIVPGGDLSRMEEIL